MPPSSHRTVVGGLVLSTLLLGSCDRGGCGGGGLGAGDMCPPPTYGYARVRGQALRGDGSPIAGKVARVGCDDPSVGGYDAPTNAEGRFDIAVYYSTADTTLYPFPSRAVDGSFDLSCIVFLQLSTTVTLTQDPVAVRFTTTEAAIVPTVVELREPAQ